MIKCKILVEDGYFTGIDLNGHANAGPKGEDIVCSAVSVLVYSLVNTLEKVADIRDELIELVVDDGSLKLDLRDQANEKTQILIAFFVEGMLGIEGSHPSNVSVLMKKEGNNDN